MKNGTIRQHSTNKIEAFSNYFKKIWGKSKPLAKVFRTDTRSYLYDTGTNKILSCDNVLYEFLAKLFHMEINEAVKAFLAEFDSEQFLYAAKAIKDVMKDENVLLAGKAKQFGLSDHYHNYEDLVNSSLEILFLEITENCNLRCDYCIYNNFVKDRRNHGQNNMSLSTAQKAIDYLHKHSFKNDKVSIAFYGGEPLLRFSFIKSCVEYAKSIIKKQKINFSITTNAILLSPDIAEFFFKNNFSVFVSIDGPEEIHDSYRKDMEGGGSFKKSILGFKNLVDAYGKSLKEKIWLSMVYTPPFSSEKINKITGLWEKIPWIPKETKVTITYPSPGSIPKERIVDHTNSEDKDLTQWAFEKYWEKYTGKGESHPVADSIMERELAVLMQRPIFPESTNRYDLNGCCIPGVRRVYVSATGNFHVCERISYDAPTIGNVNTGVDVGIIKEVYIDQYDKISLPSCSECWAIRLCTMCYTSAFDKGQFNPDFKERNCAYIRKSQERILKCFCLLLEYDSKKLKYLYDIALR